MTITARSIRCWLLLHQLLMPLKRQLSQKVVVEISGCYQVFATTDVTILGYSWMLRVPSWISVSLYSTQLRCRWLLVMNNVPDIPKVVSVQRLRPGSQSVVSAFQEEVVTVPSFDVRFVLTEAHSEYDAGKTAKENADRLIEVENATVSNLVVGVLFAQARSGDNGVGYCSASST